MKSNIESGFFLDKIPYVKHWTEKSKKSKKNLVYFPGSLYLLYWPADPLVNVTNNRLFVPEDYTLYIMGYPKKMLENHTVAHMVDEYAQIISDHIGPATILTISYGGYFGISLAARYPYLVDKLLLVTSAHSLSEEGVQLAQRMVKDAEKSGIKKLVNGFSKHFTNFFFKILSLLYLPKMKRSIKENPYPISTFLNAYRHILKSQEKFKPYLSSITAPTMVLGGTKDKFGSETIYKETAELIPNSQLILFNSGHLVTVEKAKEVKEAIFKFLLEEE